MMRQMSGPRKLLVACPRQLRDLFSKEPDPHRIQMEELCAPCPYEPDCNLTFKLPP